MKIYSIFKNIVLKVLSLQYHNTTKRAQLDSEGFV